MALPFVGPSYALANRKASVQRTINMCLVGMETPSKAPFILQSTPGLTVFATLSGEIRGVYEANGRAFVVAGGTLYELNSSGAATSRGTLLTSAGPVDFAWGTTQLVIVDGTNGYALTLATNAFGVITDSDWLGSDRVGYLDGYFIFASPSTQAFYISAIDDATSLDTLDFASAESAPDKIIAHIVNHREVWFLGETTSEVWFDSAGPDFPFSRNQGAILQVGCMAKHSVRLIDSSVMWIGKDINGAGIVFRSIGYQAQRISTIAVEEALQSSSNISAAVAWTYQANGQTFYCINAPGLTSTWCYEVGSGAWHERADQDTYGQFSQFRVTCHGFALGLHLVGDADGYVYKLNHSSNYYGSDLIRRTRISPNDVTVSRDRIFFREFALDCTSGQGPQGATPVVELTWSDNGGMTWGNPVQRSVGAVGNYYGRVVWNRLGEARDRVWRVDFSDNAPFSIIDGVAS